MNAMIDTQAAVVALFLLLLVLVLNAIRRNGRELMLARLSLFSGVFAVAATVMIMLHVVMLSPPKVVMSWAAIAVGYVFMHFMAEAVVDRLEMARRGPPPSSPLPPRRRSTRLKGKKFT